jgi:hypothetical protein
MNFKSFTNSTLPSSRKVRKNIDTEREAGDATHSSGQMKIA